MRNVPEPVAEYSGKNEENNKQNLYRMGISAGRQELGGKPDILEGWEEFYNAFGKGKMNFTLELLWFC